MESLTDEVWDLVISGTSLPQSLLALSLSKTDLKVLHVDQNDYYGGYDAGLSRDEAEKWCQTRAESHGSAKFAVSKRYDAGGQLGPSRVYTISLKPQIIYAKSSFLPTLVSSQIHSQLEFQAVGSFWVNSNAGLQKIPSNREDVFADDTLSMKDKRKLMGLLRYVLEEHEDDTSTADESLEHKLRNQFKIPDHLQAAVQALTLSPSTLADTNFTTAMQRLKRHLHSMGYFGPGMAAVMAKYGGNPEIAQVACRAGAVGGFVYLLGQGVVSVEQASENKAPMTVTLTDGLKITTKRLVGSPHDLPSETMSKLIALDGRTTQEVTYTASVISDPLRHLFTTTSDAGHIPAVAIVLADNGAAAQPPVYLQVHSEDTGECPAGQSIIYASTIGSGPSVQQSLEAAVRGIISSASTTTSSAPAQPEVSASTNAAEPNIIWSMTYTATLAVPRHGSGPSILRDERQEVLVFPVSTYDQAFDDSILESVQSAWEVILGEQSLEHDFLRFENRSNTDEE